MTEALDRWYTITTHSLDGIVFEIQVNYANQQWKLKVIPTEGDPTEVEGKIVPQGLFSGQAGTLQYAFGFNRVEESTVQRVIDTYYYTNRLAPFSAISSTAPLLDFQVTSPEGYSYHYLAFDFSDNDEKPFRYLSYLLPIMQSQEEMHGKLYLPRIPEEWTLSTLS